MEWGFFTLKKVFGSMVTSLDRIMNPEEYASSVNRVQALLGSLIVKKGSISTFLFHLDLELTVGAEDYLDYILHQETQPWMYVS